MKVIHNECKFEISRYFDNKAVIKITAIGGTFTDGSVKFITESISNLTTNFGGGFEEWVKDNY